MILTTSHLTHALAIGPVLGIAIACRHAILRLAYSAALVACGGVVLFAWSALLAWCLGGVA